MTTVLEKAKIRMITDCWHCPMKLVYTKCDLAVKAEPEYIPGENCPWSLLDKANAELERERLRLAACGVVALSDTPESAKDARSMSPEYQSASCDDVARRVDECMTLRKQNTSLLEFVRSLATQHLENEMSEDERENADYFEAYEYAVNAARATLEDHNAHS